MFHFCPSRPLFFIGINALFAYSQVDCPTGLVCCTSASGSRVSSLEREDIKIRSTQSPKIPLFDHGIMQDEIPDVTNDSGEHSDAGAAAESEDEVVTVAPAMPKVDDSEDFFYPELILDPIPNDEFP